MQIPEAVIPLKQATTLEIFNRGIKRQVFPLTIYSLERSYVLED
jgi:hypothetical protein